MIDEHTSGGGRRRIRTVTSNQRSGGSLRRRLFDVAILTVAVALAVVAVVPAYGTPAVAPLVAGALLGAGVVLVTRAWAWSPLIATALTITVYLLIGPAVAVPALATARVLPSLDALVALLQGVVTAWKEMLTLEPPLGAVDNLLVVPFVMSLGGTVLAGMLGTDRETKAGERAWHVQSGAGTGPGRRSQLRTFVAAAIPAALLVSAILLGTVEAPLATVVGIALAVLLLPWLAWRWRTWHPKRVLTLALMAAVAASSGVYAAPLVAGDEPRTVLRHDIVPPFDPRDQPSPLAAFRKYIKDQKDTELFTVRGLPENTPVRLATMDAFDGVVWNVADSGTAEGSGAFRRVGERIPTTVQGTQTQIEIEIQGLDGIWLPTVGQATGVEFAGRRSRAQEAAFRFNDVTGAAVLPEGLREGDTYVLDAVVPPVPDDAILGSAEIGRVLLPNPLQVPESVGTKAAALASSATTPALVARALETTLAQTGWFSHGIAESNDYPSLAGHGAWRINELLTATPMVGDSEQYASAMALMARHLGLPSRVVLGFVADDDTPTTGDGGRVFRGDDIRAWVEIAYVGHGWVPYFPTPPETKTPSEDMAEEEAEPQPQVVQPPPAPEDPVDPPEADTEDPDVDAAEDDVDTGVDYLRIVLVTVATAIPILLLVLPPLLILAAKARRLRRRRSASSALARATGAWDEVVDVARDHDHALSPMATRRENARSLMAAYPQAPAAAIAERADAAVFAPGMPADADVEALWSDVDAAVDTITRTGSRWARLRGRLSLASLKARRTEREAGRR